MATTIQVEIEHRRYVDLCVARRGEQGRLNITTIEPGQPRALIKLFAAKGDTRTPLQTIDVRDLPGDPERHTPMQLTSAVVSEGRLRVRLYVEGALFLEQFVPVGRFLGLPKALLIGLLILLILGFAGAIAGFFLTSDAAEPRDAVPREATEIEQPDPMADDPSDDPAADDAAPEDPAPDDAAPEDPAPDDGFVERESVTEEPAAEPIVDDPDPEETDIEPETYVVRFNPESARLRPDTVERLDEIAQQINEHTLPLRIDGHTAIAGTPRGRRELSERRAGRVRDYLVDAGVSADRITELRALGATEPLTQDPDRQDDNRRVEIIELEE